MIKPRLLIVWIGGMVPGYMEYFDELCKYFNLTVLSPSSWVHGSRVCGLPKKSENYRQIISKFIPANSSKYIIPALPLVNWKFRPDHVYIIDEHDRLNTALHVFVTRICLPSVKITTYKAQNIFRPKYYRFYHSFATWVNFRLANGIITITNEARKVLNSAGYKGPARVIPLGVSNKLFFPGDKLNLRRKYNLPENKIIICYAGSLSKEKGIYQVAEIINKYENLELIIAGSGPLKDKINSLNCNNIKLFKSCDQSELRDFYQLSDYIILPSISTPNWKEQFGRVLTEGILCGCTALGSNSGNIPNIVRDTDAIFNEDDPHSLPGLLNTLPLKREKEIHAVQLEYVNRKLLWPKVASKTAAFFNSLLISK